MLFLRRSHGRSRVLDAEPPSRSPAETIVPATREPFRSAPLRFLDELGLLVPVDLDNR